ncbi:MAG: ROK family protein [Acholeplasmataceae bacterium]
MKLTPVLDPDFRPSVLENLAFKKLVSATKNVDVTIAIERHGDERSLFRTRLFADREHNEENKRYIERLTKSLLWIKGGYRILFSGPRPIGQYLQSLYRSGGKRAFDAEFMGRIYGKRFVVELREEKNMPRAYERSKKIGRHLAGYRIGFDAGGSDRKVAAVVDGKPIYSEEVIWHPKMATDLDYHRQGILDSLRRAASKMPRVDAIGISSAGIYIDNRAMAASLFMNVKDQTGIENIYIDAAKKIGDVPLVVANDGDVTALAGSMTYDRTRILGIAMGTSEAAGYIDSEGSITGWLNELAFVPVDHNPNAVIDEWSGDYGCGVKYFSQDAVIELAKRARITFEEGLYPAEKLRVVQDLLEEGDERAQDIFRSIGTYLGYGIMHYRTFYEIETVMILGRVTSGKGGRIIIEEAKKVLDDLTDEPIELLIPGEKERRLGQAIAAASLPALETD